MVAVVIVFAVLFLVAVCCRGAAGRSRPSGAGRAALRAYRTVGDARAVARGTIGRRLVRRSVFRAVRRW